MNCCRLIHFFVPFILDVADLVTDWLFYYDVSIVEKGLVYGPPEDAVVHALLAFSIIGSFTFLFESVNSWREVFRDKPWLNTDLVSAIVIWIEDLPQIAINLHIALCREDPISVFQLSKAVVVLIDLVVRFIIIFVKCCHKASRKNTNSKQKCGYRFVIILGLLINSGCAIAVFIFTQTVQNKIGKIIFQVPETLFEDKYNEQRYFQNTSVFIHLPEFDISTTTGATNLKANWVRFMSVNDIQDHSDLTISYNYIYEKTATHLNMAFFVKNGARGNVHRGAWSTGGCYMMDLSNGQFSTVSEATCHNSLFSSQATSIYITFTFIPPGRFFRKHIFGDIQFNAKSYQNLNCNEFKDFTDKLRSDPTIPSIHYFRSNATMALNSMRHLLIEGGSPRFYRNDGADLQSATQVWKTGWGRCQSSGSMAPHFRKDIPNECSNMAVAG